MNSTPLVRLAAALGVALLLWVTLSFLRRPVRDREEFLSISRVDTAQVDSVIMIRSADTTRLVRTGAGKWQVNGLPASTLAVQALFTTVNDTTVRSEVVAENAASHARLGVAGDSALHVRMTGAGKTILELTTGKRASANNGIYVKKGGDDRVFAVSGALSSSLSENVDQWRDKQIASIPSDSVVTVEIRRGNSAYSLKKTDTTWKFASGGPASQSGVASLLAQYSSLSAQGFPSGAQSDSIKFDRSRRVTRLLNKDGRALLDLRFDSTASGIWVRHDSGGPIFRIDTWTYSGLAPAESTLRAGRD